MVIELAETDDQIRACFPVLVQLRTHVAEAAFVERVRRQQVQGYRLASVAVADRPVAVAGFRIGDNLAWGRFLYVDDLVTDETHRSDGHGQALMEWLVELARSEGCDQFHLDSGVQRYDAHRFYLRNRMEIRSHHFSLMLRD